MWEWRPGVEEHLGYYVYLLSDPRDGSVFYVGKGLGSRCFSHLSEARKTVRDSIGDYEKLALIRAIEDEGLDVTVEILRHGLTESEAFMVESVAIDLLGFGDLANRVVGHGTSWAGRMSVADVNAQYGAHPVEFTSDDRLVLIRVPRRFSKGMSDDELYEATRKWWRMGPRRLNAEHALAIHAGVVRAVYRVDEWVEPTAKDIAADPSREGRHGFVGHRTTELDDRFLYGDVTARFPQGNQNPIRYIGC